MSNSHSSRKLYWHNQLYSRNYLHNTKFIQKLPFFQICNFKKCIPAKILKVMKNMYCAAPHTTANYDTENSKQSSEDVNKSLLQQRHINMKSGFSLASPSTKTQYEDKHQIYAKLTMHVIYKNQYVIIYILRKCELPEHKLGSKLNWKVWSSS